MCVCVCDAAEERGGGTTPDPDRKHPETGGVRAAPGVCVVRCVCTGVCVRCEEERGGGATSNPDSKHPETGGVRVAPGVRVCVCRSMVRCVCTCVCLCVCVCVFGVRAVSGCVCFEDGARCLCVKLVCVLHLVSSACVCLVCVCTWLYVCLCLACGWWIYLAELAFFLTRAMTCCVLPTPPSVRTSS